MARLTIFSFVLLAVLTYVVATANSDIQAKLAIIKREAGIVADAVRAITIQTPHSKVQLYCIAADFIVAINYATFSLNNVIPNLNATEGRKELAHSVIKLDNVANDIETKMLTGDPEKIKKKVSMGLEFIRDEILKNEEHFKLTNNFATEQLRREFDFIVYGIYKVKFQTLYFNKLNKDLETELKESLANLTATLNAQSLNDNKLAEQEMHHALGHISMITERCTYKLQNWVEVNNNNGDDVKVVEEIITALSGLYENVVKAAAGNQKPDFMKNVLLKEYGTGINLAIKAGQINYPDNSGGTEFIRSCMFDAVTIGRAYAENINSVLSKS